MARGGWFLGLAAAKPVCHLPRLSRDPRRFLDHSAQRRLRQPRESHRHHRANDAGDGDGGRNRVRPDRGRNRPFDRLDRRGFRPACRDGAPRLAVAGRGCRRPRGGRGDRRALNGAMVAYGGLPSFLVTLGTMGVFGGVARRLTNLQSVSIENGAFNGLFGSGAFMGAPSLVLWTAASVAIGYFVFRDTRFGAHVHAIGDSAEASLASGIKVLRLRFVVMLMSGVLAALAGLLYAGRINGASYTLGEADLLTVIAAVIVGGTRLTGGVGSIFGALIGSWLMGMLNNGLILMGYQPSDQMVARGAIILIAVALTLRDPHR